MGLDCTIVRNSYGPDGVFGLLQDDQGNELAVTLEHAYLQDDGSYAPKTPAGNYTCKKGQHQLAHMPAPFTAFELLNVPGHTNILIHKGNYNNDSEGCILIGATITTQPNGDKMITDSSATFDEFMALQSDVDGFTLTVV